MTRTALQLAALASAAVPGLDPVQVSRAAVDGMDFDVAVVNDDQGRRWVVRSPRRVASAPALDTEVRLLPLLSRHVPVPIPQPAGRAPLPEGGECVVYPYLPGAPIDPQSLAATPALAAHLGRVLAAVHEVDPRVVDDAGLPGYTADAYRQRRLSDVDRAAATGHVPAELLARWEHALEDVGRWRFAPTLVHGDLAPEHVLVDAGQVSGIIDWGEACIADPADDLAWLALPEQDGGLDDATLDTVVEAYTMSRREPPDRHLLDRARLAGELALARWLLAGTAAGDDDVIHLATERLHALADRVQHPEPVAGD